jgi:hypothetical protein
MVRAFFFLLVCAGTSLKKKRGVWIAYTKLANVLWTNELQRRFDAEKIPITAMSVHPGNVMSGRLSFRIRGGVQALMIMITNGNRGKRQALHVPDLW